jgi:hypothetical protein
MILIKPTVRHLHLLACHDCEVRQGQFAGRVLISSHLDGKAMACAAVRDAETRATSAVHSTDFALSGHIARKGPTIMAGKQGIAVAPIRKRAPPCLGDCPKPEGEQFLRSVLEEQKPRRANGDEEWLIGPGRRLRVKQGLQGLRVAFGRWRFSDWSVSRSAERLRRSAAFAPSLGGIFGKYAGHLGRIAQGSTRIFFLVV